ncbi:ABC transporter permease [Sutcliffiella deserti]|uniref:ABC transporter permease n=1 Tax=Sutcliffiella deserti TaxID=2875501 RepID=UPI001CBFB8AA|nr:ABC transporter permease [Sutcliffiella deserti]
MWSSLFYQTGGLTKFILRRDRVRLPIWLIGIISLTILTASAFTDLYPTEVEKQTIAETMKNPAMIAMLGPGYGLDNYTEGPMMAHQMLLFTAIVVAIMNILLVTRHTRTDEEDGRVELIRSLPVGRLANLTATLCVALCANLLMALLIGLGLFGLGIESIDLNGSLLYGMALGATGIFFAAVTTLFVQLSENSRGAIGYSFAILGGAYLIRAIGDVSNETISWLSPLGWILKTEAYVNNYWLPLILTTSTAVIIILAALYLNSIRDLDSGFIPQKPGKRHASTFLTNPFGLAFRLQRTGFIAWAIGMFILGLSYGSVFGDLESFFATNEIMTEFLAPVEGYSLTEQYLSMLMSVISMICTVPALMFMLKLKGEENKNRTEHLLSRAVSRNTLLASYFVFSLLSGFLMLFLSLIGLWLASSSVMEDPISFSILFRAAMVYLPAILIMIGVTVLLLGLLPKLVSLSWLYLGYSFFVVYLGGLLQFPEWMGNLSPFGQIPQLPVEEMDYLKVSILTGIAFVLVVVGFVSYNKRDITG